MILILAGTSESREIIQELKKHEYPLMASVVTDYGYNLLKKMEISVLQQTLNEAMMIDQIRKYELKMIIDATHPFAREASVNALRACQKTGITYLRFQREGIEEMQSAKDLQRRVEKKELIYATNFHQAAKIAANYPKILLTIGSKNLDYFIEEIDNWQERLIIRILSDWSFVKRARELGFSPANIIAMQGPFSKELNKIILQEYSIDLMVCKDSGQKGGLHSRLLAASELNIPLLLIKRPVINYQRVVSSIEELLEQINVLIKMDTSGGEEN